MRSSQPDRLRELVRLMRSPEPGSNNLGSFVATHASELGDALATTADDLKLAAQCDDDEVRRRIGARVKRAVERLKGAKLLQASHRTRAAADLIAERALWAGRAAVLDSDLVLGDLLADPSHKHIGFALYVGETVLVERTVLVRARLLRRLFLDVACFVNESGLHFRWRGGRGALNLKRLELCATEARDALVVSIPSIRSGSHGAPAATAFALAT